MRPAAAKPARQSRAGTRSLLSSLASADDGGSENAARAGVAEARHESDLAVEKTNLSSAERLASARTVPGGKAVSNDDRGTLASHARYAGIRARERPPRPDRSLPVSRIRGSTGDRYNDARDFRTLTNRAVGNAGLVPSQREPRSGLQIEVRA